MLRTSRRDFLRSTLAAGTALTATSGCSPEPPAPSTVAPEAIPDFELDETTIADLQRGMESGRFTARSVAELYLARIEAVDRHAPALHSILDVNPEAVEIAEQLDRERRESGPRGPLHGIPVLLKDNVATADRMNTDAIVAPTGGPAWVTDLVNGDHFSGGSSTLAAVAGYPNVTVPSGEVHGLPVGISFFGGAWSEPLLLACAFAFEQATSFRRKPQFRANL